MTPQLTVCCVVNVPPERVAATLAPLRSLEPEIVLVADDRVDEARIDGYRQLADRVIRVPFPGTIERMAAWLLAQCGGRWILRLDGDEVPAPGVAGEVAATIAAADVTHCWLPRRWLYPDATRWLAQWPWRPDYSLRLLRNDPALVSFEPRLHGPATVAGPYRHLRAPIYHADLLLNDRAAREAKCAVYDRWRPDLVIDGRSLNEAYYLPERSADLRTLPVDAEDAVAVTTFIEDAGQIDRMRPPAALDCDTAQEIERHNVGRPPREPDYRARIALLDDDLRLVCGEPRTFDVEVENRGGARWPGGMADHPQIRLAYRWIDGGGAIVEGLRTGLGAVLAPGARAIVPLEVLGPPSPGTHELEIDLVHEHVRWFDCAVRARIDVRLPRGTRPWSLPAP